MSKEERDAVTRMVGETVICLRKSSTNASHIGTRYAKLITLLWRRPPKQKRPKPDTEQEATPNGTKYQPTFECQDQVGGDLSLNAFSWLDLSAVGDFATRNNSTALSFPDFGLEDTNNDYINGFVDNQQWFNDQSPSFVF